MATTTRTLQLNHCTITDYSYTKIISCLESHICTVWAKRLLINTSDDQATAYANNGNFHHPNKSWLML